MQEKRPKGFKAARRRMMKSCKRLMVLVKARDQAKESIDNIHEIKSEMIRRFPLRSRWYYWCMYHGRRRLRDVVRQIKEAR